MKEMEAIAEFVGFASSVCLVIPVVRVSAALKFWMKFKDSYRNADASAAEILRKVQDLATQDASAWRPLDHKLLVAGILLQVASSAMKIGILL